MYQPMRGWYHLHGNSLPGCDPGSSALGDAVTVSPRLDQRKLVGCETNHLDQTIVQPLLAKLSAPGSGAGAVAGDVGEHDAVNLQHQDN